MLPAKQIRGEWQTATKAAVDASLNERRNVVDSRRSRGDRQTENRTFMPFHCSPTSDADSSSRMTDVEERLFACECPNLSEKQLRQNAPSVGGAIDVARSRIYLREPLLKPFDVSVLVAQRLHHAGCTIRAQRCPIKSILGHRLVEGLKRFILPP